MTRPHPKFAVWLLACLLWAMAVPVPAQDSPKPFTQQQLDELLAPIALYPDALLAQVLMASTYPLEVVEAARWSKANPKVTGKALEDAMSAKTWDASVKSLTAFPQVLATMNEHLDWTQKLGDAFLAQQQEVMATVQNLRLKAHEAGNLKTTKEQNVVVEQATVNQQPQTVVKIVPADPEVVYVPTYNPTVVYGSWGYPSPPPYYWGPAYAPGAAFFTFATGVAIGAALWGDCDWGGGDVDIDIDRYNNFNNSFNRNNISNIDRTRIDGNRTRWEHNVDHRKGVAYRDNATANRFRPTSGGADAAKSREAFRGRAEAGQRDIQRGAVQSRDVQAPQVRDNSRGAAERQRGSAGTREAARQPSRQGSGTRTREGAGTRPSAGTRESPRSAGATPRQGSSRSDFGGGASRGSSSFDRPAATTGRSSGAFDGVGSGGSTRDFSQRGNASRGSFSGGGGGRSFSGGGGGSRGGGGGGARRR